MKKKTIAGILAFVLLVGAGAGVTLAYLTDKTTAVTNTFTYGNVDIDLWEHKYNPATRDLTGDIVPTNANNEYKITPGVTDPKDPTVTVIKESEACYVFIQIEEANNKIGQTNNKYVNWEIADGWTKLTGVDNVWYQEVSAADVASADKNLYVLKTTLTGKNGSVSYNSALTNADLAALGTNKPTLTFTAYAVQKEGFTSAADAWAQKGDTVYNKDSGTSQSGN